MGMDSIQHLHYFVWFMVVSFNNEFMKPIDKIKQLMTKCKSIDELIDAINKEEFSTCYMRQADETLKKEHDINPNEIWHRFWIETSATPVNKWENVTNYTTVLISDDLREMKVVEK